MDPVMIWVVIIVGALAALWIAIILIGAAFTGAIVLLGVAANQGFIGLAVYIALWVFLFPVMLAICIVIGLTISIMGWFVEREREPEPEPDRQ